MAEQDKTFYCAYADARRIAAQHRNYGNCLECKKAHQKCKVSGTGACERCIKLRKTCSLPADRVNLADAGPGLGVLTSVGPMSEEETQRFGNIIYVMESIGEPLFEVIHVRIGRDGHDQVYKTKCDKRGNKYVPVGPPHYLGPWTEIYNRFQASLHTIRLEDIA